MLTMMTTPTVLHRPAAVMQRIDFNNDNAVTTLTIRIEKDGYYGIFTEHMYVFH